MKTLKFAGIGARKTPQAVLKNMKLISKLLTERGMICRSGGAIGADTAFEQGAAPGMKEIFTADHCTTDAEEMSSQYHPGWMKLSSYVRRLHGRNAMILLGRKLDDPVDFVVCWTERGETVGGTGQAIRIAEARGIKVYNIARKSDYEELQADYAVFKATGVWKSSALPAKENTALSDGEIDSIISKLGLKD